MVVFGGAADLAAAGHDEPRLLCPGELRPAQPALHQAGDAPGVGGCDNHQTLIRLDRRAVLRLDTVVHAEKLIAQGGCDALCNVPAVSGTAEIEYHVCASLSCGKGRGGLCSEYRAGCALTGCRGLLPLGRCFCAAWGGERETCRSLHVFNACQGTAFLFFERPFPPQEK